MPTMLVSLIQQQHEDLRELFARHQEALLQADFELAQRWLGHFADCQKSHMQIEERYLFPIFAKIERQSKWDVSLYEKEHSKIDKLIQDTINDVNWLSEQELSESDLRRNIIALLDKQKTLKGLNEHHEDREETAMLKELEQQLEEHALKVLASDIKFTWAEVRGALREAEQC